MIIYVTVRVKWGKEKFDGVDLNTDEPPEVFKMQLFSLSGEPDNIHVVITSHRVSSP